jgi:hypothetical protein
VEYYFNRFIPFVLINSISERAKAMPFYPDLSFVIDNGPMPSFCLLSTDNGPLCRRLLLVD